MIEKLYRLLESFKENDVSNLLLSIREKIVTTLNSDYFSEQSKAWFSEMEKCPLFLMSEPLQLDTLPVTTTNAYLITSDNTLYYFSSASTIRLTKLNVSEENMLALKKTLNIHEAILDDGESFKCLYNNLPGAVKKSIFDKTAHTHTEVEPFANFEHQPKKIIQIKQLINALYYAQRAFSDLENVNFRNGNSKWGDVCTVYNQTISSAYKASYLLTHLDIDLTEAFSSEISVLIDLFSNIKAYADGHKKNTDDIAKLIMEYPLAFEAGKYAGIAIDQLQPNTGKVDYRFLTQLSAVLPGYIQQFTTYLRDYTAKLTDFEPNLNKQKINELENNAVKLLNAIQNLQNGDALLTVKIINYINIISHIITLSTSIIQEAGHMTETSQDVIRDTLAKIKYEYLPQLFALADKIEDQILLAPGTLSKPLMEAIIPYYQELINYASKPVDFTAKGEELLTIEDYRFLDLRIKETRQRINRNHEELIKVEQTKIAFENFFKILEKPEFEKHRLVHLDNQTKQDLANHYRFIQPWFEKNDIPLNNEIITSFTKTTGTYDKFVDLYNWAWAPSADSILNLLSFKKRLSDYVESGLATHKLHIQLNNDIIKGIYQRADIAMRPLDPALIDLKFNDARVLNLKPEATNFLKTINDDVIKAIEHIKATIYPLDPALPNPEPDNIPALNPPAETTIPLEIINNEHGSIITNPNVLTANQALSLYTSYEEKHADFLRVQDAYEQFLLIIEEKSPTPLFLLCDKEKEILRNLYLIFQPFFIHAFIEDNGIKLIDKAIITNLQAGSDPANVKFPITQQHFINTKQVFEASLNKSITFSKTQRDDYYQIVLKKYNEEILQKELIPDVSSGERATYLIKHTKYSKAVAGFRLSLFEFTKYFNKSITDKLKPSQAGIPFPEMESKNQLLSESKQIVILKRIFNALYHLEQICHELENLDNTSYETTYVYHLALAYKNINSLKDLIKSLSDDPQLIFIAKELMKKVRAIKETLSEQIEPYIPDANLVTNVPQPIQYQAIWYSLHALMRVPEHLQALNTNKPLTEEQLANIQSKTKQTVVNIERIINKSNSYFKLLLEIPTMYSLFKELRQKLSLFTSSSHMAIMSNLKELNSELFARILMETDLWESKMGLKPGLLSGHMKSLLDEFYKGINEPLGLISQNHIENITNMDAFDKRLAVNNKRRTEAQIKHLPVKKDLEIITRFISLAEQYTSYLLIPTQTGILARIENELVDTYKLAYPIIKDAQPEVGEADIDAKPYPMVEKFLRKTAENESMPAIPGIHAVAVSTRCHLNGMLADFQLEHDTSMEQNVYLQNLRTNQILLNEQFVLDYTNNMFERRVDIITSRQTDLLHLNLEYNEKLKTYLTEFKSAFVAEGLLSKDINATMKKLIQDKTDEFQRQFLSQYTQLDNSLSVLSEFRVYFKHTQTAINENKTSLFENQETIGAKTGKIDALEKLARDSKMPAAERIEQLRTKVGSASFEVTIMAHRTLDVCSFAWLKRLFLKLLEVFKLYTPTHVKYYNNLKDAVSENPNLPQHRRYPGFFAETERPYALPKQVNLDPEKDTPLLPAENMTI